MHHRKAACERIFFGWKGAERMSERIVIVGAGQSGLQIAESLRAEGFAGELVLLGEETSPPYQRPPLSKA